MISPTTTRTVPVDRIDPPTTVRQRFRIAGQPTPHKGVRADGLPTPRGMARIIRSQPI